MPRIQSALLITRLTVVAARQVEQHAHFHVAAILRPLDSSRSARRPEMMTAGFRFKEQAKCIIEQITTAPMLAGGAKRMEKMEPMKMDQNDTTRAKLLAEHVEAMIVHPSFQKQVTRLAKQMKVMDTDPYLHHQAKLVADQVESMLANPSVQEKVKLVKKMSAMMRNPTLQAQIERAVKQKKAMKEIAATKIATPLDLQNKIVDKLTNKLFDFGLATQGKSASIFGTLLGNKPSTHMNTRVKAEWRQIVADDAPSPRSSHQISADGSRVYIFGGEEGPKNSHFGYGAPVTSNLFYLDLESPQVWGKIPETGTAPSARLGHGQAIVRCGDERFLYVFGGRQPEQEDATYDGSEKIRSLNDMHRICIAGKRVGQGWEKLECTGDIPSPRSYLQMLPLEGDLYVFGGMINDDRYSDLYSFNTTTNRWTRLLDGPMEGRGGAGVFGGGQSIWVVAGFCGRPVSDVWEYNIATKIWQSHNNLSLPVPRSIFGSSAVGTPSTSGFPLLLFGGELDAANGNNEAGKYSSETILINTDGVTVLPTVGTTPAARGWTSACVVHSPQTTRFVVFGGIRVGEADEPLGVRLGDLQVLELK